MSAAGDAPGYRIIGSGPVALSCGLWMVRAGIAASRIALHRPAPASPRDPALPADPAAAARRLIALSEGSRQLLSRVMPMPVGGVIERIDVHQEGTGGRTRIEARDFGLDALGTVIAWDSLVRSLSIAASAHRFATGSGGAESPFAALGVTIHAEGMPRPDHAAEGHLSVRHFDQHALLTEVISDAPSTTAFECFGSHGPLALLPSRDDRSTGPGRALAGPARHAVVWCDTPAATAGRAALSPEALSAAIGAAFARIAGRGGALRSTAAPLRFTVCAPVTTSPLTRITRRRTAVGREVWIGNASQALHPVAGQGLNLGLRDAFELATLLADQDRRDPGDDPAATLRRFAAQRRRDRNVTTGVTDLLARAFTWPLARPLQSLLLTALDLSPALRRPLADSLLFGQR